ncbi:MAG: YkgJ family cysteine cluster protein, partial [Deltaproteobacteria bacterium]
MPPATLPEGVPLLALRPLRAGCHGSGACCHGWQVELTEDEPPRILELARALAVAEPIVDGVLRREDGRCVFLDDALRCRIHATFGADAKPRTCRLYPLRAVFTEDGLRVGVDPSCASTFRTWESGPRVEPLRTIEQVRQLAPALIEDERALLTLASVPGMGVAGLAGALVGDPTAAPELPAGLTARLL